MEDLELKAFRDLFDFFLAGRTIKRVPKCPRGHFEGVKVVHVVDNDVRSSQVSAETAFPEFYPKVSGL